MLCEACNYTDCGGPGDPPFLCRGCSCTLASISNSESAVSTIGIFTYKLRVCMIAAAIVHHGQTLPLRLAELVNRLLDQDDALDQRFLESDPDTLLMLKTVQQAREITQEQRELRVDLNLGGGLEALFEPRE